MKRAAEESPGTRENPILTPELALRQGRIIVFALIMGVVMFYVVTLVVAAEEGIGDPSTQGITSSMAMWIWGALVVASLPAVVLFRGRAAGRSEEACRASRPMTARELGEVSTNALIAAALLEGPALFAGAMTFVNGATGLLPYAAFVFLVGMSFVFPRAEWYGADPRRS